VFRFDDGQVQSLAVVYFRSRRLVTGASGTFRRIRACYDEEKATLPVESLPYIAANEHDPDREGRVSASV
jgi:hypothetical protein